MKKQLFISGPILGMEDNQDYYRNIITTIGQKLGFEIIDPWKREKCDYTDVSEEYINQDNYKYLQYCAARP